MDKPILFYEVRQQLNRVTGDVIYVPAIVERDTAIPLDEIIRRAIDRGLIVGLKPSAAQQVAKAIAEQMYEEFRQGRGIKFGDYFYARLYLDGTSDADGRLVEGRNGINVRFANGTAFKLTLDMFSFSNIAGGDIPGTDFLISDTDGAQRNRLVEGVDVLHNGVNLFKEGDLGTRVKAYEVAQDGSIASQPTAIVETFSSKGPNLLQYALPASLEEGGKYLFVPERSADNLRWFVGTGKNAEVIAE